MVRPLLKGATRLTLALDDTPTKRYGPHVQGAGIHHNPTPGPAGSPYVYGHVFVVLACSWPTRRGESSPCRCWPGSTSARRTCRASTRSTGRPFRTKLELAVELLRWAKPWLGLLGLPIWVVADGAYAKKDFLKPAMALGMTVVSRLRKDAALRTLPGPRPMGKRGRPRTYGPDVIDLAKRGGQRRGWSSDTFDLYGEKVGQEVQDVPGDLASGRRRDPGGAGGRADRLAGVLLHRHLGERRRHPGMVADRFSLEITFRECKQVVGAGSSRCGSSGRTSGRSTSACGRTR